MKKIVQKIIGALFVAFAISCYMQIDSVKDFDTDLANIVKLNQVSAEESNPCMVYGYVAWDFWYSTIMEFDCSCSPRDRCDHCCM